MTHTSSKTHTRMKNMAYSLIAAAILAIIPTILSAQTDTGHKAPQVVIEKIVSNKPLDADGKFLLLDFWATWCGPCKASFPHTDELAGKFADKMVCLAVSSEGETIVRKYDEQTRFDNILFAVEGNTRLSKAFGVSGIPHYFLIAPDNTIVAHGHPAALTERKLRTLLETAYDRQGKREISILSPTDKGSGAAKPFMTIFDDEEIASYMEIRRSDDNDIFTNKGSNNRFSRNRLSGQLLSFSGLPQARVKMELNENPMTDITLISHLQPVESLYPAVMESLMATYGVKSRKENFDITTMQIKVTKRSKFTPHVNREPGVLRKYSSEEGRLMVSNYDMEGFVEILRGIIPSVDFELDGNSESEEGYDWDLRLWDDSMQLLPPDTIAQTLRDKYGLKVKVADKKAEHTIFYQ